jgi:PAS domain S-box-containing protein
MLRRKRHEHEADTAQGLLAAIVESSQDAIISKTLDGIITSWNPGAEQLFGYTAQEAIGQPVYFLIPPANHAQEDQFIALLRKIPANISRG